MTLELDTTLFDMLGNISINQLVFLTLVLNENQNKNQDIHKFLSRISEAEIQELIINNIITVTTSGDEIQYKVTDKLNPYLEREKTWFDEFYELFPVYVMRPDGTKGFLRSNINKCRNEYKKIVGKSLAMHNHILECLKYEQSQKMMTGKLGYFKTMWKWLTQREWEIIDEQMHEEQSNNVLNTENSYGTNIL